jgi:hypothetical protein
MECGAYGLVIRIYIRRGFVSRLRRSALVSHTYPRPDRRGLTFGNRASGPRRGRPLPPWLSSRVGAAPPALSARFVHRTHGSAAVGLRLATAPPAFCEYTS